MCTRDYMLTRLEEHIKECYEPPTYYPKRRNGRMAFVQRSYSRWAANEFLNCLKRKGANLILSGEQFIKMMDIRSCGKNGQMFSIAYDVAVDLLDYLYTL